MFKLVAAICILLLLLVGGVSVKNILTSGQNKDAAKNFHDKGTLAWRAAKAKKEGKTSITIPAPIVEELGTADPPEFALNNYTLVVAQPIASLTTTPDDSSVVTWYKFKVLETISKRPPLEYLPSVDPPQELLPVNNDEFIIARYGGRVLVDDVAVDVVNQESTPFSSDNQYLLFISRRQTGFANLWAGATGVFTVKNFSQIEPLNDRPHPLKQELKARFGNSLAGLRQHLGKGNPE